MFLRQYQNIWKLQKVSFYQLYLKIENMHIININLHN